MFNKTEAPQPIDQATIDFYVAKGRRERSQAFLAMIKSLFTASEPKTAPAASKKACAA